MTPLQLLWFLYLCPYLAGGTLTQSRIRYENISVVVSSSLPPEKCPQILDKIK
ncbi:Epithelial chloride channel proteinlike, partial [Caligus rogercresseyi]